MLSGIQRSVSMILLLIVVVSTPTASQDAVRRMTLDDAVLLFNENNLLLRQHRATSMAVAGAARQTMAYPNPTASVTHETVSDRNLSFSETYFTLTQSIDWPWRYGDRREAGARKADAAFAELRADSAQLVFDLKRAYVEAAAAEAVWEIVSEVADVFRQADRSGTSRLEEGDISSFELKRIRIERARYEQTWVETELELTCLRRVLAALTVPEQPGLQVAPTGPLSETPPSLDSTGLLDDALQRRGEVSAAMSTAEVARAYANVARWSRLPDPALTGGYKRQSDGLDGVFLGVAIPLPWWDRKGGAVAAAAAQVEASEAQEEATRVNVIIDVTTATENYLSLARRAELIGGDLLSDVDDVLAVALLSYTEGELTLLELLDAVEAYSDAGIARAMLTAAHWIAYYDLERAVGGFNAIDGQGLEDK